jgi:hypothetical protein
MEEGREKAGNKTGCHSTATRVSVGRNNKHEFTLNFSFSEHSRSISACSTVTSTDLVATATSCSASMPSSSHHHMQSQQRAFTPPSLALEDVVKMDRLNIQTPTSGDDEADDGEFEVFC